MQFSFNLFETSADGELWGAKNENGCSEVNMRMKKDEHAMK